MKNYLSVLVLALLVTVQMALSAPAINTNETDTAENPNRAAATPRLNDAAHPALNASNTCTIYMIGDSTMSNKPLIPAYPERGWGQLFPLYFKSGVHVENYAMNGRSSKSFITEGRWKVVRDQLKPGDWVFIQFGHNDNKPGTDRYTDPFGSFTTNLTLYVKESQARGAHPVLCTPIARRKFDNDGKLTDTHGDFVIAVRRVATNLNVPLLDLTRHTEELLRRLGPDRSKMLYDWVSTNDVPQMKSDLTDDTHLNAFGASRVCDLAVDEIKQKVPALAVWLNK